MALLSLQQALLRGTVVTLAAAGAGGDTFSLPHEHVGLRVKNGSASSITVTIAVPGNTPYGVANPSVVSTAIAAGAEVLIGPIPLAAVDSSTGLVTVTYSSATSVTVGLVAL